MKQFSVLCAALFLNAAAFSQTLISYGNSTVDKDEFLRAYNKNKPAVTDKEKALRDYLELYTNFKLKVKAAQELHLDTIAQIRYDTQNFRDQIAANYLTDEKGMQSIVNEAIARSAKDLHVIYFSVPVTDGISPADTMKAYNAANELYNILKNGSTDYATAVTGASAKFSPAKYADAGYITAFSLPYEIENIVYNTAPGSISRPYRGAKGWLIFKVTDQRPDAGKWKAAQILFAYPPEADYNTKLAVKEKADSVYRLLQNGMAFDAAAKQFSDDRMSYSTGGELPEFGTGKYADVFEQHVFSLKNDNDISVPFETAFGYHIVKRMAHTPLPVAGDAAYISEIKQRILNDSRINNERELFARETAARTGFKRTASVGDAELLRYADSVKKHYADDNTGLMPVSKKTIITFKDGTQVKGSEWLKFVKSNSNAEVFTKADKALLNNFTDQQVINYYKAHLETYNPDFRYQMQEFREGNMLFEIMERNVWSKAGADSAGLAAYYNAHKENYKWENSADVLIFNCTDEKTAQETMDKLRAGKTWQALAEESNNKVQSDSGRYELSQIPGTVNNNITQPGNFSAIIKNSDGTAAFVQYIRVYPPNMQRNFYDARGLVINDYQNVLEQRWVEELRKRYPVKINEAVVKQMLN